MSEPKSPPPSSGPPGGGRWSVNKEELASHLAYWSLLRVLLWDWRFRWAAAGFLLVLAAAAVGLPRMWRVSPPDFNPIIRVSALDLLQARVYGRLAQTDEAAGDRVRAGQHWRQAVANDPTSPPLLRGSISNLLAQPPRHPARFSLAIQTTFWLLQLTRTNRADLDLAIRACEHFGMEDLLVELVRSAPGPVSTEQEIAALKATLRLGHGQRYADQRAKLGVRLPADDPDLALHQAAWQAGWGEGSEAAAGRAALTAAEGKPDTRIRSLKFQLLATANRHDVESYGVALDRLRDQHADEPGYHVAYWMLLRAAGRTNDAVAAARMFSDPPVTSAEVVRQAQALLALGLDDDATKFLEHFAPELGVTSDVWLAYANVLIEQRRWRELRSLALQIRQNDRARAILGGYSWFIEGLADHELGAKLDAAAAFASVPQYPIRDGAVVLQTAAALVGLGAPAPARDLLLMRENEFGGRPDYWRRLLQVAWELRDADLMLRAAERQYALAPRSRAAQTDLAAALLIFNRDNDRVLELTGRVVRGDPTSLAARVNHACALIRNGQMAAAKPLLLSVDETRLNEVTRNAFNFVRAELFSRLGQRAEAATALGRLDTNLLMAPQLERLRELQALAAATNRPTASAATPR